MDQQRGNMEQQDEPEDVVQTNKDKEREERYENYTMVLKQSLINAKDKFFQRENMSEKDYANFEHQYYSYRELSFDQNKKKQPIKRLVQETIPNVNIHDQANVLIKAASKVYIEQFIEQCRDVMHQQNQIENTQQLKIQLQHVIEAQRRIKNENKDLSQKHLSKLFE